MKTKLIAVLLLAGSSLFARTHVSVGIGFGAPVYGYGYYAPPPLPPVAYAVPAPGPGYVWISSYYYPAGGRYVLRPGYWTRPPYRGARWIAPRHSGGRYYNGYWRR